MRDWMGRFGTGLILLGGLLLLATPAWSAHAWVMMEATPEQVRAGEHVRVTGIWFSGPAEVRLGGFDGPLLGTFEPGPRGLGIGPWRELDAEVTLPSDLDPGQYTLVAFQPGEDGKPTRIPGRVLATVVGDGGAPVLAEQAGAPAEERPAGLVEAEPVGFAELALVGLGVAGGALLLGGAAALVAARRPATTRAASGADEAQVQP